MSPPVRPQAPHQLTPDEYDKLKSRGWSDEEIQADNLILPATQRMGSAQYPYRTVDAQGKETVLPPGSGQPLRTESKGEHVLGAIRAFARPMQAGFGDEMSGASAAMGPALQAMFGQGSGQQVVDAYTKARDAERGNQSQYAGAHGTENTVMQILGSLVPILATAGAAAPEAAASTIPPALQSLAKGFTGGGTFGAVNALGNAEGPVGDQINAMAGGAQTGSLLGTAAAAAPMALKAVGGNVWDIAKLSTRSGRRAAKQDFLLSLRDGLMGGKDLPPASGGGNSGPTITPPSKPPTMPPEVMDAATKMRDLNIPGPRIQRKLFEQYGWGKPPEPPVDKGALGRTAARIATGQPPRQADVVDLMRSVPQADLEAITGPNPAAPKDMPAPLGSTIQTVWNKSAAGEAPAISPVTLARSQRGATGNQLAYRANALRSADMPTITHDQYLAITSNPDNLEALLMLSLKRLRETGRAGTVMLNRPPQP